MKVDLVIGGLERGGAEKQLCGLAKALASLGIDVRVVTLFGSGPLQRDLESVGVPLVCLGDAVGGRPRSRQLGAAAVAVRLVRYWRSRRPDAIQAWLPEAQVVALPVARLLGIPVRIMAVRSMSDAVNLSRGTWKGVRLAARCATGVTGNSQAVLDDPDWAVASLPRTLIRNGISIPDDSADVARQPARGVMVANLTAIKGHASLLEAIGLLTDPPHVELVGQGPMEDRIRQDISARSLTGRVTLVGGVDDVWPVLLRSQFAVLSSPSEGLPNALLEAMAAGLPVVAFRTGGIPEVVEDGATGLLVAPGDVAGLASAIARIAADPAWRSQAGARARARMANLSWENVAKQNLEAMDPAARSSLHR